MPPGPRERRASPPPVSHKRQRACVLMFHQLEGMPGSGSPLEDLQAQADLHSPPRVTDSRCYDVSTCMGGGSRAPSCNVPPAPPRSLALTWPVVPRAPPRGTTHWHPGTCHHTTKSTTVWPWMRLAEGGQRHTAALRGLRGRLPLPVPRGAGARSRHPRPPQHVAPEPPRQPPNLDFAIPLVLTGL